MFEKHIMFDHLGISVKPNIVFQTDKNKRLYFDVDTGRGDLNRNEMVVHNYAAYCGRTPDLFVDDNEITGSARNDGRFEVKLAQIITNIDAYRQTVLTHLNCLQDQKRLFNPSGYCWINNLKKRNVNYDDFVLLSCYLIFHSPIMGAITHNLMYLVAKSRLPQEIVIRETALMCAETRRQQKKYLHNLCFQMQYCYNQTYQCKLRNNELGAMLKLKKIS